MTETRNPFYDASKPAGAPTKPDRPCKPQRSKFWIVSTHILTTAFVMPIVAGLIGAGVVYACRLQGNLRFLTAMFFQLIGYIGGTYYSISYLRKETAMNDPQGCTLASILTFAIMSFLGFAINVWTARPIEPIHAGVWLACFFLIQWPFAQITRQGFAAMAEDA